VIKEVVLKLPTKNPQGTGNIPLGFFTFYPHACDQIFIPASSQEKIPLFIIMAVYIIFIDNFPSITMRGHVIEGNFTLYSKWT
jgi:hypothetical protein